MILDSDFEGANLGRLASLVLVLLRGVGAQSFTACEGNSSIYSADNLTVTFDNLCGRDIQSGVDLPREYGGILSVRNFGACMDACVQAPTLCYGFDSRPDRGDGSDNCWLMNAVFTANRTDYIDTADAAMLDLDSLPTLADDCQSLSSQTSTSEHTYSIHCGLDLDEGQLIRLPATSMQECLSLCDQTSSCEAAVYESSLNHGFYNCHLKNTSHGDTYAQSFTTINAAIKLSNATSSSTTASATGSLGSSAATSPSDSGLSTGAQAGMGAGIGAVALVAIGAAVWYTMRQRRRRRDTTAGELPTIEPKSPVIATELESPRAPRAELEAHPPHLAAFELESPYPMFTDGEKTPLSSTKVAEKH